MQYTPNNMYTIRALFCFVVVCFIYTLQEYFLTPQYLTITQSQLSYPEEYWYMAHITWLEIYDMTCAYFHDDFIMTSWHGNAFRIACPLWGESQKSQKGPRMRSYDTICRVSLNKLLNKQSNCRWFERPCLSCDITVMYGVYCTQEAIMTSHYSETLAATCPQLYIWQAITMYSYAAMVKLFRVHIDTCVDKATKNIMLTKFSSVYRHFLFNATFFFFFFWGGGGGGGYTCTHMQHEFDTIHSAEKDTAKYHLPVV